MSYEKGLVSIISPCYNSEKYIFRMLDSVRKQTYKKIEMICVDDGSDDDTGRIIKQNIDKFEEEGMRLIYIKKNHAGQAAAINYGLKHIHGEYLTTIDSDDFYAPQSIEKRLQALLKHTDCSIAVSDYYMVDESDLSRIIRKGNDYVRDYIFQPRQFCLLLAGHSVVTPIGYLIKTESMRRINPHMEINECIEGQNYQILLPLYYHYKRVFVDEPLAYYVIRKDSHDHRKRTEEEMRRRWDNLCDMLKSVLEDIGLEEYEVQRYLRMSYFYRNSNK
ncbi:MAG: glycosyltransferase family 2 protein [Lachnospiraceae bacterium]|nr:glycosyltransferase family 2 protein [Lachnospiraceae bacterium]